MDKKSVSIIASIVIISICIVGLYYSTFYRSKKNEQSIKANQKNESLLVRPTYEVNLDEQGHALHGYDAVTYFEKTQPMIGNKEFSLLWNNATWQFSSAEHRAIFEKNPNKFAPANGGFCTFGVALGKKFDGDPKVWLVKDEQLYVFLNSDIKNKFLQDEEGNLQKASFFWPQIKGKPPEELEDK